AAEVLNAGCPPDGGGGAVLVAGEHGDVQPMVSTEPSDDIGRLRPEFVTQGDRADRGAVVFDEHDGRAGGLESFDVRGEGRGLDVAGLSHTDLALANAAADPGTDVGGDVGSVVGS